MLQRMAVVLAVSCLLGPVSAARASQVAISEQLETQFNRYVSALLADDSQEVQQTLSAEKLQRYANAQGTGLDLVRFVAVVSREKDKLLRTFGPLVTEGVRFELLSYESLENGLVLKAQFAIGGNELPKPVYFVKEGEEYKINFNPPANLSQSLQEFTYDSYRAENDGNHQQLVSCGSLQAPPPIPGGQLVPPQSCFLGICTPGHTYVSCPNLCGSWAGSWFYGYRGSSYSIGRCDYNTWGRDVWFDYYGNGRCNDSC
ncbi:hypothetical protein SAMN05444354_105265 [Stigmatella aurantiaca]|uniref:Uncharacterized protein n=1 Tax=Stigmatella aurantiaca TaxID=41 RepID=A0A1H7PEC0_STIAU|nr:hypothetical protein [Stigmatella aurantiaca]SEL34121.1 hypothetical protein SAMN05444354_105265 [Stigmatella aurantiaca]